MDTRTRLVISNIAYPAARPISLFKCWYYVTKNEEKRKKEKADARTISDGRVHFSHESSVHFCSSIDSFECSVYILISPYYTSCDTFFLSSSVFSIFKLFTFLFLKSLPGSWRRSIDTISGGLLARRIRCPWLQRFTVNGVYILRRRWFQFARSALNMAETVEGVE